jgi:DNA-binding transcriptional ArsR family regulator
MSDHTLAYSEEDFRHRFLVVYEAAGMTSDRMSYFVRTLLSENRICHETVEKTPDGMRPRVIEKEGPTGLITTTTAARLHPENETRMLSLSVKDTPEQTRAVMRALAADDADDNVAVDFGRWQAFQRYLAAGERGVTVPFGQVLADLIPAVAVRLRRDFKLLLTMIQAHALLHREMRTRDNRGRIIAEPADYGAVRELIAELVAEGIEATVPKTMEETVAAVKALGNAEVSISEIARALKLDKSSVSHRVRKAIDRGYLVNYETARGRPARIGLGSPIPAAMEIMPHPDALTERCSVGLSGEGIEPSPSPVPANLEEEAWTL